MSIRFVYLDEFGHIGPFMSRKNPRYNESPVFGLAGIILPEDAIRPFATKFLQLKEHVFAGEIARSGVMGSHWEKHGSEIFTPKHLAKYPHFRSTGFRLLNYVRDCGGKVFYYGRVKITGETNVNSVGLYTTILAHTIRQLENFSVAAKTQFVMVVDEHSTRKQLLVTSLKTMYDQSGRGAKHLLSPPFEVESYINQNIQAADWVAAIVGRLAAYAALPDQYRDHEKLHKYFFAAPSCHPQHGSAALVDSRLTPAGKGARFLLRRSRLGQVFDTSAACPWRHVAGLLPAQHRKSCGCCT